MQRLYVLPLSRTSAKFDPYRLLAAYASSNAWHAALCDRWSRSVGVCHEGDCSKFLLIRQMAARCGRYFITVSNCYRWQTHHGNSLVTSGGTIPDGYHVYDGFRPLRPPPLLSCRHTPLRPLPIGCKPHASATRSARIDNHAAQHS